MKTVILCGGRGMRLGEHGASVPKALIEIGGQPVLWHILKLYAHHGLNDFVLCSAISAKRSNGTSWSIAGCTLTSRWR